MPSVLANTSTDASKVHSFLSEKKNQGICRPRGGHPQVTLRKSCLARADFSAELKKPWKYSRWGRCLEINPKNLGPVFSLYCRAGIDAALVKAKSCLRSSALPILQLFAEHQFSQLGSLQHQPARTASTTAQCCQILFPLPSQDLTMTPARIRGGHAAN